MYDTYKKECKFIVTGSGRLELFKKGGDSLFGRYFSVPLFPLTMGELNGQLPTFKEFKSAIQDPQTITPHQHRQYQQLSKFSGFPEPFFRADEAFYNRWFLERKSLLLRQDIRQTANIRELSPLEMLSHLIPERAGGPLSINALKEDIGVAFETVRDWLLILEQFFYLFRLSPYTGRIARSLRKETKVYLYDWVEVPNDGARFGKHGGAALAESGSNYGARWAPAILSCFICATKKNEKWIFASPRTANPCALWNAKPLMRTSRRPCSHSKKI